MAQIPLDLVANSDFDKISMKVDLAEERDDKVKYRIRLMIDLTEYITYRDYKQFKNFHCSLKFSFPRFDFSEFPSKFVLLNKKEHRRKGFDKFLSNIKKIGLSLPEVPKKNLKRLLLEFIAEEKMNLSLDSIYCKDEIVYKSQVKPSDGFFTGFIDIRLEEEDWITYYGSLINSDLYLFPNDSSKYFITVINCSGTDILKSDLEKVIEIHHQFEKKPILIRSNKWEEWKNHLVIVSNFANSSKSHKIKSNGRLIVKIYSGQNIKLMKPAVSLVKPHAFVRITVGGFRYETSILPQEYLINWNQTFILPVFNRFFVLEVAICRFSSEGLIKQTRRDDVLEEFSIPLIDLNQYPYTKGPVRINQLTIYLTDQDIKKGRNSSNAGQPCVNLDIIHQFSFAANFIGPPSTYIEDELKPKGATINEFKLIFNRLKRVIILYQNSFEIIGCIFLWKYPLISLISMIIYCLIVVFIPSHLVFCFIILIIALFCFILSPMFSNFRKTIIKKYFCEKYRIKEFPQMITLKESKFNFKKEFENFKVKDKENVLDKIKTLKLDADEISVILAYVVSFSEKIRNLFLWEDPQKTQYFCFGLIIIAYILYSVPFRILAFVVGVVGFILGRKKTKYMIKHNKKVCSKLLENLFPKYIPNYIISVTDDNPWNQDFLNNKKNQKKFVDEIRFRSKLDIDLDAFEKFGTPKKLYEAMSSCETMLKYRREDGQISEKSKKDSGNFISGFFSNIPSEYYRYRHPRVKNIQACS